MHANCHFLLLYTTVSLQDLQARLGREQLALVDLVVARNADYAVGTWMSSFTRSLHGMRSKDGRLTLLYYHFGDAMCFPDNIKYMQATGRESSCTGNLR